ncbi:hypothetical protein MLD38_011631 [Melastoma candidum]|uniref:Uncharacterized protein n=1 Tax=Melastoma candidum TaxID=119954 RepID=A0ACB9R3A0_9MYRT|nr:hypothetical protein MLD38_011631 [Melastoma candidum]
MDLFRSERMTLVQLIIPVESAYCAVSYLGEFGLLQFRDLNANKSPFQRTFANQVKRCGEMARKLQYFKDQILKSGITSFVSPTMQPDLEIEELEIQLTGLEHELDEINHNDEKLRMAYNELLEFKIVLQKASGFLLPSKRDTYAEIELGENVHSNGNYLQTASLLEEEVIPSTLEQSRLSSVSGIVCKSKRLMLERMLFRATRGNMLFNQSPADEVIVDPSTSEMVEKVVFVVLFSGEQTRTKILKVCEAFDANCYPVPEDVTTQRHIIREVLTRLSEMERTLDAGLHHRNQALISIAQCQAKWANMVRREMAIYKTLNMLNFDVTKKCLVGEGWCPTSSKAKIQEILQRATYDSKSQLGVILHEMEPTDSPPTYFRTNSFTKAFQEIVDAYGVAGYQEVNPTVYTIVTFPFLFAVMFGDWGHGICLLLGALALLALERKLKNQEVGSFMGMLFAGRYVLLLMAVFTIYCGLIYNEFFSIPFDFFGGSAYKCRDDSCSTAHTMGLFKYREPYAFGVDPRWRGSRSELPFLNSLKMKMSILLGVVQMNLGILLSYFNARFFGKQLDIRYQFLPQMIFLNSLFGYLSMLIVVKWCSGSQADLYHVMIYMFLSPTDDLGENQLFRGQKQLQIFLLLLALTAVPWMLFPKPFIKRKLRQESFQGCEYRRLGGSEVDDDMDNEPDPSNQRYGDFNFSEAFVHQMIHCIEFVLGAVSNTASYLRLWALSLAHSELSTVFYERILLLAWGYDNFIIRLGGLATFAFTTAFILLMMETLSAFLHALRLHWVEFQNKFYHGNGHKFRPFSFSSLTEEGGH